ncbi:MAG: hypothetical protein WKF96_19565 [Solirubrobacteraceae bacterium]
MRKSANALAIVGAALTVAAPATGAGGAQSTRFTDAADPQNALDARAARVTTTRTETRIVVDFTPNTASAVDRTFGPLKVNFSQAQTATRGPGVRQVVVSNAVAGRVTAEVRDGTEQRVASATARLGARRVVVKVPTAHLRRATRRGKTWFRADLTSFSGEPGTGSVPGGPPVPADAPRTDNIPDIARRLPLALR